MSVKLNEGIARLEELLAAHKKLEANMRSTKKLATNADQLQGSEGLITVCELTIEQLRKALADLHEARHQ